MNQRRLEILTEELSMRYFLEGLLPRILPEEFELNINCFVYHHQGKTDLQKRLPNRIRAYQNYPQKVLALVIHDQDSNDCILLKAKLIGIVEGVRVEIQHMIRIACRELENWYLGDLEAVEKIYPKSKVTKLANKAKFRNPDNLNGSDEMKRLCEVFTKIYCAREIGSLISVEENKSVSFNHLLSGLQKLTE